MWWLVLPSWDWQQRDVGVVCATRKDARYERSWRYWANGDAAEIVRVIESPGGRGKRGRRKP